MLSGKHYKIENVNDKIYSQGLNSRKTDEFG